VRKVLLWIAGILAAIWIGGILVDRRHTYKARLEQLRERREALESEAVVIDRTIKNASVARKKRGELQALEKQRAAIRDKAARLHKSEVSYEKALARLGHDPADWGRLGLGD
jgi:DNA/RNA-binding domain of Phe-tRNA-synthetase-like protein